MVGAKWRHVSQMDSKCHHLIGSAHDEPIRKPRNQCSVSVPRPGILNHRPARTAVGGSPRCGHPQWVVVPRCQSTGTFPGCLPVVSSRPCPTTAAVNSRSGLPCLRYNGPHGVSASHNATSIGSDNRDCRHWLARKLNSFITPITLRLAVFVHCPSPISANSAAMNTGSTPIVATVSLNTSGNRSSKVAAGDSGIRTGNSVCSFTSNASCGRQNSTVPYQLPSHVVGSESAATIGCLARSRSLPVACNAYTLPVLHHPQRLSVCSMPPAIDSADVPRYGADSGMGDDACEQLIWSAEGTNAIIG